MMSERLTPVGSAETLFAAALSNGIETSAVGLRREEPQ